MSMRIHPATPALAPFVREWMVVEVDEETIRVRMPETGLVLGIRYRGAAEAAERSRWSRLPDFSLAGAAGAAREMRTSRGGGVVLARFQPGGAARFFSEPLHRLLGQTVALEDLIDRSELVAVADAVSEAKNDAGRIAIVEKFLARGVRRDDPDPVVTEALRLLRESRGAIRIGELAGRLAISQDPLEKRFRRVVGASPKQLSSLLRLQHALAGYRPGASLAQLAQRAGYFDQSHFIRAFRAVTGMPPGRFLRTGAHL